MAEAPINEKYQKALLDDDQCPKRLDWLCKLWKILFRKHKGGDPCIYIPERIINRPDVPPEKRSV